MKILVILGHPRSESLGGALAKAYCDGARLAGGEVRRLNLAELDFNPDVLEPDPTEQHEEHGLEEARRLVQWAEHVVFVYPTWWGTVPARLKGFLDRILLPGFAFVEREGGGFAPLLMGRTAELMTTMDTPAWVYRWIYGAPGHRALARATLGFCGFDTVRVTGFGPVNVSTEAQRAVWIRRAGDLGHRLGRGARSPLQAFRHTVKVWLRALRPQFYPVTIMGVMVGALAGVQGGSVDHRAFWMSLICVVGLKAATVLTNDIFDEPSDAANRNWSIFTGGSRSLVENRLSVKEMWLGTGTALAIAALSGIGLLLTTPGSVGVLLAILIGFGILAVGYTVPPLKLSYRGLGELTVALTHGLGVVLWGYVAQGGSWSDSAPWLLGLLIGLAVFPAIVLAGIPDRSADAAFGKRTLVVRLGIRWSVGLALGITALAAVAAAASGVLTSVNDLTRGLPLVAVPHALVTIWLLGRYHRARAGEGRIDGLMAGSLLFIMWFVAIPALNLL